MKVNDELEQAFREGYVKGYKAADKGQIIKIIEQKIQRQLDRTKSEVQQREIDFINKKGEYFNEKHNIL